LAVADGSPQVEGPGDGALSHACGRADPVSPAKRNVRPLRPIRILLASDDVTFVDRIASAARDRSVAIACVSGDADVHLELVRHSSNVLVFDADEALPRGARYATAFAALHPGVPVVLIAERAETSTVAGLLLLEKWCSTERLLGEIELAYLGLRP
jgi:hypothetical protein